MQQAFPSRFKIQHGFFNYRLSLYRTEFPQSVAVVSFILSSKFTHRFVDISVNAYCLIHKINYVYVNLVFLYVSDAWN